MALGKEAIEQLSQELAGGHKLNARLLALLRHPLDRCDQETAMAMSQELSRVFMVSLFMLKSGPSGDSGRVVELEMVAPEERITVTEGSIGQRIPAKDKHICGGEEVTLHRMGRQDEVTEKKITALPHNDGYQWRKYGQKYIRNRKFARCYYKCMFGHDRGCRAKKMVQQQDNSRGRRAMFQVTYVNEHKCQQALANEAISTTATLTTKNRMKSNTTRGGHFDHPHAQLDTDIMASCLGMVMGGAAPAPSSSASLSLPQRLRVEASSGDPAAYGPAFGGGHSPSMQDTTTEEDTFFPSGPLFFPVFAAQSISHSEDVTMAVPGLTDTASAWPPQYS